ncbi:MAG: hypothetical protein KJO81_12355 [Gammaproteobacteria bacterium]|nr:hypothetical protein [Gammaproteobacteria bacterium]
MNITKFVKKSFLILLCSCFVFTANVYAGDVSYRYHSSYHGYHFAESGSAEAMVADVIVARPIGLVASVVGSAVYVVSLPFSLLGGNEKQAREKLVKEPTAFTFKRPLGEFPSLD